MKLMTLSDAQVLLAAVVEEKGEDHTALECRYFTRGEDGQAVPHCIVGHVFTRWGLPPGALWGHPLNTQNVMEIHTSLAHEGFAMSNAAVLYLDTAQRVQDGAIEPGLTWGLALRAADLAAEHLREQIDAGELSDRGPL